MKKALLFVLALAVIPVGVDAQGTELAQLRALAEQGNAVAQYNLGVLYATGQGVPQDNAEAVQLVAVSSRARECGCPDQPRAYVRQWRRRAGGLWRCPNGSRL